MEIYFWFRKSTKSPSRGSISCVIRIDGIESVPFSTKIKTEKKFWNAKSQCFEGKGSGGKEQTKNHLINRLFQIHSNLQQEKPGVQIYPDDIRNKHISIAEKSKKSPSRFVDVLNKYVENLDKLQKAEALTLSSVRALKIQGNAIIKFLKTEGLQNIACKDFDESVIDSFQQYMVLAKKKQRYINNCIKFAVSVQKYAFKKRWTPYRLLADFSYKQVKKNPPIVLEPFEVQKIQNHTFPEYLQRTADAWLFCQETALSFSDYHGLKNDMVTEDSLGRLWIDKNRIKTDQLQIIPLSSTALDIINKYGGTIEQLPRVSATTGNRHIKQICLIVSISTQNVSWHTSRKSWAHKALNYMGMSETTIAKVMGWSSTQQLKDYARINRNAIANEYYKESA